ncbi:MULTISPECIES: flagellar biosynthetic protein FliO [Bacillaceae]|uniref:flagellar biosynthetic protein FliO n=1 Tax=Bacillaceae TaxID=186817 RepID=UPI00104F3163|nr:flagellar biosynthetic protein FliO [Bacillus sp. CBEL-1]TDB50463.1 flagellar biosynthesis protein FliZ [Bacillus sp. CBEL-1]
MLRYIVFILGIAGSLLFQDSVSVQAAETSDSVKECIENPSACEKELDANTVGDSNSNQGATISAGEVVKMLFAFAFVIGLLLIVLRVVKSKGNMLKQNQLVENLGGTNLGNSKSVQVVKVGEQLFVVGVGDNIELLSEVVGEDKEQLLKKYHDQHSDGEYKVILPSLFERKEKETIAVENIKSFTQSLSQIMKKRKAKLEELERNRKQNE